MATENLINSDTYTGNTFSKSELPAAWARKEAYTLAALSALAFSPMVARAQHGPGLSETEGATQVFYGRQTYEIKKLDPAFQVTGQYNGGSSTVSFLTDAGYSTYLNFNLPNGLFQLTNLKLAWDIQARPGYTTKLDEHSYSIQAFKDESQLQINSHGNGYYRRDDLPSQSGTNGFTFTHDSSFNQNTYISSWDLGKEGPVMTSKSGIQVRATLKPLYAADPTHSVLLRGELGPKSADVNAMHYHVNQRGNIDKFRSWGEATRAAKLPTTFEQPMIEASFVRVYAFKQGEPPPIELPQLKMEPVVPVVAEARRTTQDTNVKQSSAPRLVLKYVEPDLPVRIHYSTNLVDWAPLANQPKRVAPGTTNEIEVEMGSGQCFFKPSWDF